MAETLCTLRKIGGGGGELTPTTLWTNPSPGASVGQMTVTLSDSVSNYKYIKFNFLGWTGTSVYFDILIPADQISTYTDAANTRSAGVFWHGSSYIYYRRIVYVATNQIKITLAGRVGQTGSSDNALIPQSIVGLK